MRSAQIERETAETQIALSLNIDGTGTFAGTTGIGFLIGRYKKLKRYQTPLFVRGASAAADKVLSVSGIYTLIPKI